MIVSARHQPAWRRYSGTELRLRQLRDAVEAERGQWAPGDPINLALGRALRACETAARCAQRMDPSNP